MIEKSKNYDAFKKAFNHFDSRPLSGENLKKFYIDDFTKQTADQIGKSEAWHGRWGRRALWVIALTAIIAVYMQYFS